MTEDELSKLHWLREGMRQTIQVFATIVGDRALDDDEADQLYLEADSLIQFEHAPVTTMSVVLGLLKCSRADSKGINREAFVQQVKAAQSIQEIQKLRRL